MKHRTKELSGNPVSLISIYSSISGVVQKVINKHWYIISIISVVIVDCEIG